MLYDYIHNLDVDEFEKNCDLALRKIIEDDDNYITKIDEFISLVGE